MMFEAENALLVAKWLTPSSGPPRLSFRPQTIGPLWLMPPAGTFWNPTLAKWMSTAAAPISSVRTAGQLNSTLLPTTALVGYHSAPMVGKFCAMCTVSPTSVALALAAAPASISVANTRFAFMKTPQLLLVARQRGAWHA